MSPITHAMKLFMMDKSLVDTKLETVVKQYFTRRRVNLLNKKLIILELDKYLKK